MTTKSFPIPVRVTGPGSHVEEEEAQYLDVPRDMRTFEMPRVPETEDTASLTVARDTLARLLAMMNEWQPGAPNPVLDMRGVAHSAQTITNQMLGDGEVSIQVNGQRTLHVQESVFTGVWHVVELDGAGQLLADWLEAAPLPSAVLAAARDSGRDHLLPVEIPAGAMNSPALLHELQSQLKTRRSGDAPHVLNLTLVPLTPEDHQVLGGHREQRQVEHVGSVPGPACLQLALQFLEQRGGVHGSRGNLDRHQVVASAVARGGQHGRRQRRGFQPVGQ